MKLKTIMWAFTLLTISTVLAGLFIYYNAMKTAALNEDKIVSETHIKNINGSISQLISRYNKIILTLSRHEEIVLSLKDDSETNRVQANQILDLFNSSLETSVCYLLNRDGIAIASSNRNDSDSFLGNNYSFRPYYKESMQGNSSVYLAYGVTSGQRGIYFSKPVYAPDSGSIVGVAVIKEDADKIESDILFMYYPTDVAHDDIIVISNEVGVVFISDREDLLFNTIWQLDENKVKQIAASKQFGKGPWPWAGFKKITKEKIIDRSDRNYNLLLSPIKEIPGWKIIHFSDSDAISDRIHTTTFKAASYVFTLIFIIIGFVLVILNFLANKAEKELREREERHRSVTEAINEGVILQAQSGEILTWNKGAENIFGILAKDVIGQTSDGKDWPTIYEDGSKFDGKDHPSMRTLRTGKACINEIMGIYQPSGDLRWISVNTNPLLKENNKKPYAVAISFSDITERKQAEKELRENERELQLTLDATADGIWSWNFKTNELYFSPKYYKMLGYMPNEFPADFENWLNLIHPDDRQGALEVSNEFLKTKPDLYQNEFRLRTKNGDYRWARTVAKVVERDENGDAVYMIGNHEDFTERKLALDALIEEQERFELAMRSVNDGLWDWNIKTNEIYYSPVWKRMLGYEDHEIENKLSEWERLTDPEDIKTSWVLLKEVIEGKKKSFKNEFKMLHKDGHWVDILARADVINDENGEGARVIGTHVDITEQKRLEKQLQQYQKMEAIGTLAGGIAHDFNNILFPIVGHTEMLIEDTPEDSPSRDSLNEIYTAALRARNLVQQILAFSRQENSELKLMKMQSIIKEALKLIRSTIPTTITINQSLQPDCGAVKADPTQIHQIVMNLTTNAYHAMENDGGELKVVLKEVELGQQDLIHTDLTPGKYACLTVSDTGIGITKDVIDKIFEPFFTTKEKGKGTGMGLSVVHGIIKNMSGKIEVDSELGKGTEFHIYLPIAESAFKIEESPIKEPMQGGDERIFLVDDEEVIIKMEKQALERLGYHVTSRISSIEALELFRTNPDKFDLVITDMAMPKMSGDKLAVELIKIRFDIPILLCTGFSEAMTEEKVKSLGIKGLLLKPIIIKDLARKIREVLDEI